MKKICGISLISTAFVLCSAVEYTVKNEKTEIVFDDTSIVSIKDISSDTEFTSPAVKSPIYTIKFAEPSLDASSKNAADVSFENKSPDEFIIRAKKHKGLDIAVECRFWADKENGLIKASIKVDNKSDKMILRVTFPTLWQKTNLGDNPREDILLSPNCDGLIVRDPINGGTPNCEYPGSASMQMFARYAKTAGIFVGAFDTSGLSKIFIFYKEKSFYGTDMSCKMELKKNMKWESCDFALTTFNGDWQVAADIYRKWAVKQKWCAQTFKQRIESGDIAKWISEPSLYAVWVVGGSEKNPKTLNVDEIPLAANEWAKTVQSKVTMILWAWEKHGIWITPDYFPPYGGEEKFLNAISKLHENNNKAFIYLSGFNWTIKNNATARGGIYDKTELFNKDIIANAITKADGKYAIQKGHPHMGEFATICPATRLTDDVFFEPLKQCVDYGVDLIQADQVIGGYVPDCYSKTHGHPPFGGTWRADTVYNYFKKCRDYGKSKNPNFAFSVEEPCEYFIPVLDTYHARDYAQKNFSRVGKNFEGVPLFTYVYHDYLNGYGGDGCKISTDKNAPKKLLYEVGMNLVSGKMPALVVINSIDAASNINDRQLHIIKEHFRLMKEHPEFFIYGRQVASAAPEVPPTSETFINPNDANDKVDIPSVVYARWQSEEGAITDVYVCIADEIKFKHRNRNIKMKCGDVKFIQRR